MPENKKVSSTWKMEDTNFKLDCLNSPIILSWLYLGFNRNPYKCIPSGLRKNFAEAETFLQIAQFSMKNTA